MSERLKWALYGEKNARPFRLFISACEPSSEAHAAGLVRLLKKKWPEEGRKLEICGIGGDGLERLGQKIWAHSKNLTVMGFLEIIWHLPKIFKILKDCQRLAQIEKPDLAIFLDYPGFHFQLAKRFQKLGIPLAYYIPPKVWAWKKGRLLFLQKYFQKIFCILPFEKAFYQKHGISVEYVGNPLLENLPLKLSKNEARARLHLKSEKVVTLFPGSRASEFDHHFEWMLDVAMVCSQKQPLQVIIPIGARLQKLHPEQRLQRWMSQQKDLSSLEVHLVQENSHLCLQAADAALIKSGTSTLEAALFEVPHVLVFKTSWISYGIFRCFSRFPGPFGLTNLVFGNGPFDLTSSKQPKLLVQELIQSEAQVTKAAEQLMSLLIEDHPDRLAMQEGFRKVRELLEVKESGKEILVDWVLNEALN